MTHHESNHPYAPFPAKTSLAVPGDDPLPQRQTLDEAIARTNNPFVLKVSNEGGYIKGIGQVHDPVNRPQHYTSHPSGVECIKITEHMGFNLGNALKYIWRCDLKNDAIEDLHKAKFYIEREIARRTAKTVEAR